MRGLGEVLWLMVGVVCWWRAWCGVCRRHVWCVCVCVCGLCVAGVVLCGVLVVRVLCARAHVVVRVLCVRWWWRCAVCVVACDDVCVVLLGVVSWCGCV